MTQTGLLMHRKMQKCGILPSKNINHSIQTAKVLYLGARREKRSGVKGGLSGRNVTCVITPRGNSNYMKKLNRLQNGQAAR